MENFDLRDLGLLGVGAAAVAAAWPHLRAVFDFIRSAMLVTVRLGRNESASVLSAYLRAHAWQSGAPQNTIAAVRAYVRPEKRLRWVGVEGAAVDGFWVYRGRPVWISGRRTEGIYELDYTCTYVRGSLDFTRLFEAACCHASAAGHLRHEVRTVTGKDKPDPYRGHPMDTAKLDLHYVGWGLADIGAPIMKDPLSRLALTPELEAVYAELQVWLKGRDWYSDRGMPWRYSALFHGRPGTGKTSFIKAVAQDLDLPIHNIDVASMSNLELTEAWSECLADAPCIVLFEDIDRVFDENHDIKTHGTKVLTLDRLLNCMAGTDDSSGVIVFMTANNPADLDPALLRPGRLDVHVEVRPPSILGKQKIAQRILRGYPHSIEEVLQQSHPEETGAEFERRCQEVAVRLLLKRGA